MSEKINICLSQFQQLRSTTVYPTLLYIFEDCFEYKKFSLDELENILNFFISYLFRRIICGYSTSALNKIFASFVSAIEKTEGKSEYEKVVKILMNVRIFPTVLEIPVGLRWKNCCSLTQSSEVP